MTEQKRGRGRPATGDAMTSSERASKRDNILRAAGGRVLSRVRLSPEAAKALAQLATHHESERDAIEAALIGWAKINVAHHDK